VPLESAALLDCIIFTELPQILQAPRYEGEEVNRGVWAKKDENSLPGSAGPQSGSAVQSNLHRISNFADSLRRGEYAYWWKINPSNIENKA
jgi:hypothetical protein